MRNFQDTNWSKMASQRRELKRALWRCSAGQVLLPSQKPQVGPNLGGLYLLSPFHLLVEYLISPRNVSRISLSALAIPHLPARHHVGSLRGDPDICRECAFEMRLPTLLSPSRAVSWAVLRELHQSLVRHHSPSRAISYIDYLSRKLITFFNGKAHLVEQQLHDTYGHVVRTGPHSLSFSSLAGFGAIYGFNRSLEKGDFYDFARDRGVESVFSARTDAAHREHRHKIVGPAAWSGKVTSYEPVILKNLSTFLTQLTAQSRSKGDSTLNIAPWVHRFTFNTTVAIIYGESIFSQPYTDQEGTRDVLTEFRYISSLSWGTAILPWLGWLMSTRVVVNLTRRPVYDAHGRVDNLAAYAEKTRDLIVHHAEKVLDSSQSSMLKNYLSTPDTDTKHMDRNQIFRECLNFTFAGMGSTAAGLTAVLYELGSASGRDWQQRIRDESRAAKGLGSTPPVLLAVIKESMRLHAPFPTAFPRIITAGAETAIPDLPAPLPVGTTVGSNTYILGRSKEIWGDDADKWKPERWLVAGEERQRLEDKFVVFSKGPRTCIGRELAMRMIEMTVVTVLEKWDITAWGRLSGASLLDMQYAECDMAFVERKTN